VFGKSLGNLAIAYLVSVKDENLGRLCSGANLADGLLD